MRCLRMTASRSRAPPTSAAARLWTPTRRTPCRPPGRSWRGRVTAPPRPASGKNQFAVAFP